MIKIPELYNALYKVTKGLIDILKRHGYCQNKLIEAVREKTYVLDEHGKWFVGEIRYKRLKPSIDCYDYVLSMSETEKLFNILLSNGFISYPSFVDSKSNPAEKPSKQSVLSSGRSFGGVFTFIAQYLEQIPTLNFYPDIFDKLYSGFEHYHLSDTASFVAIIPLQNFSSDIDLVEFSDKEKIERLKRDELALLGARMPTIFMHEPTPKGLETVEKIFASGFAIKIAFSLEKREAGIDKSVFRKARQIITALCLTKPGKPFYNIMFSRTIGFNPVVGSLGSRYIEPLLPSEEKSHWYHWYQWLALPSTSRSLPLSGEERHLHLSKEDCKICKEVWQNLQSISLHEDQDKLDIGFRKFNDLYNRKFLEDRIIDMAILLESMLLYGTDRELGYRLSLRGAHLLKSSRDPMQTFKFLKEFYDLRSKIVHGGKRLSSSVSVDDRQFQPEEFVAEMESICREILRAFVERAAEGVSIERVNKDLDREALRGP